MGSKPPCLWHFVRTARVDEDSALTPRAQASHPFVILFLSRSPNVRGPLDAHSWLPLHQRFVAAVWTG